MQQYVSTNIPRVVTVKENKLLTSPITPEGIKDATSHMDASKAPSPNEFFFDNWANKAKQQSTTEIKTNTHTTISS